MCATLLNNLNQTLDIKFVLYSSKTDKICVKMPGLNAIFPQKYTLQYMGIIIL